MEKRVATGLESGSADGLYLNLTFGIERGEPLTLAIPTDALLGLAEIALTHAPMMSREVVNGETVGHLRGFDLRNCEVAESKRGVALRVGFSPAANIVLFASKAAAAEMAAKLLKAAQG